MPVLIEEFPWTKLFDSIFVTGEYQEDDFCVVIVRLG